MKQQPWQVQQEYLGRSLSEMNMLQDYMLGLISEIMDNTAQAAIPNSIDRASLLAATEDMHGGYSTQHARKRNTLPSGRTIDQVIRRIEEHILDDQERIEGVLQQTADQWQYQLMPKKEMRVFLEQFSPALVHLKEDLTSFRELVGHVPLNNEARQDAESALIIFERKLQMTESLAAVAFKFSENPQRANRPLLDREHSSLLLALQQWRDFNTHINDISSYVLLAHQKHPGTGQPYAPAIEAKKAERAQGEALLESLIFTFFPPDIGAINDLMYQSLQKQVRRSQKEVGMLQRCLRDVLDSNTLDPTERINARTMIQLLSERGNEMKKLDKTISRHLPPTRELG